MKNTYTPFAITNRAIKKDMTFSNVSIENLLLKYSPHRDNKGFV
jgi:hypothetical protein